MGDAFVAKINLDASQLVYSTFLGGTCGEQSLGIAVDSAGNTVVVGVTDSLDFPVTAGALQSKIGGNDTAEAVALDAQGQYLRHRLIIPDSTRSSSDSLGSER